MNAVPHVPLEAGEHNVGVVDWSNFRGTEFCYFVAKDLIHLHWGGFFGVVFVIARGLVNRESWPQREEVYLTVW